MALLQTSQTDGALGCLLSAGCVAVNVLRAGGNAAGVSSVEQAMGEAAAQDDARILVRAIQSLVAQPTASAPAVAQSDGSEGAVRVMRVDMERIDRLVRLAGELIVAKNAIGDVSRDAQGAAEPARIAAMLKEQHAVLDRLTSDLQHTVLGVRMLQMRHVFQRFPRMARELAEQLDKPVKLVTEGEEVEADKVVVEALFDPLLHILRNAMDHGIESRAQRAAAGKPEVGSVTLKAARQGEQVILTVADDGGGIDLDRVKAIALRKNLVDAGAAAHMEDGQVASLIFMPGFSTSAEVTDLSGRGVGMDVVRSTVERLGGQAAVATSAHKGTTVTLTLPVSVMMTRILTVQLGAQWYAVPLDQVVETTLVPRSAITVIGTAKAFILRDRTIPYIDLGDLLQVSASPKSGTAKMAVVAVGNLVAGLEVDALGAAQEVMVRPPEGLLAHLPAVSGTSLRGDGQVLLVLNLKSLLLEQTGT